jgi:hypothetical protein
MFKHYFEQIEGISSYPIFSLVVFLSFFIGVGLWVAFTSKGYVDHMSHLPIEDDTTTSNA